MNTTYRAILIDPVEQTVTEIETTGDAAGIRSDLSFPGHVCEDFESHGLTPNDIMLVDGEAAFDARLPYFTLKNGIQILGRGLIVGATPSGNTTNVKLTAERIASVVIWPDKSRSIMWKLSDGNNVVPDANIKRVSRHDAIQVEEITEDDLWRRLGGEA